MRTATDPAAAGVRTVGPHERGARDWIARRGWLAWGAVVLLVSVVPVGWVFGFTPEATWSLLGSAGHFLEFGLFAVLVAVWRSRAVPASSGYVVGALGAAGYGLAIEVIQIPIPYRSADPRDFAADVAGVAVALSTLAVVRRRRRKARPAAPPPTRAADPVAHSSEEAPS
jgi:VanZ family protein